MRTLLEGGILQFMESIGQESRALAVGAASTPLQDTIRARNIIRGYTNAMHSGIKQYIQGETERLLSHYPYPCSNALAQTLAGPALRKYIRDSLRWLVVTMEFQPGSGTENFDFCTNALVLRFCSRIAGSFTYSNPMLRDVPDNVDEEDEQEQVAQWYWQEYTLNDLEDVLPGPDSVDLEQVSVTVPNTTSSNCLICQEAQPVMRKTNACGHEY